MQQDLEKVVKEKIRPMLDEATEKIMGVDTIRLSDDITSKLGRMEQFDLDIDYSLKYKEAKRMFRRSYLTRLLMLKLGNVSETAKAAGIDRRSLHRMILDLRIDLSKIKKELVKPYDIKVGTMSHMIEDVLDKYKKVLHPEKLKGMYLSVNTISENIVDMLPDLPLTMKEAEHEFDRLYLDHAVRECKGNVMKVSRKIGLRYETIYRKLKVMGIRHE